MATLAKIKEHITKAKGKLDEAAKKAGDVKTSPELKSLRKKHKRLARKAAKIQYMEKKAEEKKKPKKSKGAEG